MGGKKQAEQMLQLFASKHTSVEVSKQSEVLGLNEPHLEILNQLTVNICF